MTDFEKYLNFKLITSFINSDEVIDKIDSYSSIILTHDFVRCMDAFSNIYLSENKLYKDQAYRFKALLDYIRGNSKSIAENLDLLNKMELDFVKTDYSRRSEYCVENYIRRFRRHNFYKVYFNPLSVSHIIDKTKDSASYDYFYLKILTEFSDKDFNEVLSLIIFDEKFLLSINQIIYEYPGILKNKLFMSRIKRVFDINIVRIKEVKDEKLKKIIYRESQYYINRLKEE